MDDKQIIELYFCRDEQAIKETEEKYGVFCRRIAMNILGVREDAEECVNDTYYSVWKQIPPTVPEEDCALFVRRYWFGEEVQTLAKACGITAAQMAQRML